MLYCAIVAQFTIVDSLWISGGYLNGAAWDGSYVWVTNNDNDPGTKFQKVDPITMSLISTWEYSYTSGGFDGLTYASDGFLYAVYYGDLSIWKVDPADGTVPDTLTPPTTDYPYGLAFDGTYIWYTDQDRMELWKLSLPDMSPVGSPRILSFTPKDAGWYQGHLYIMGSDNVIRAVDTADGSVIWSGSFPRDYCAGLAFGGGYMWVGTNNGTGKLYKVASPPAWVWESPGFEASEGLPSLPEGPCRVRVYRVDGRKVMDQVRNGGQLRLPKGFSVVVIETREERIVRRLLVR